jgi:glycosyltransferase involved in cell wall biosynthesis
MKIAVVAQHTTLLDRIDTQSDPERIQLRDLTRSLASNGHRVTVYTQRLDSSVPARADLGAGVCVERIGAADGCRTGATTGARSAAADERDLLERVPTFSGTLGSRLSRERPDVVHALRWTSGLAALAAARGLGIPVVQSFHSLGIAERRHRVISRTAGTERIRLEPAIGRSAAAVLASSTDEESDLTRLGVPRRSIKVVPFGVDTTRFTPEGPTAPRNGRPRLVTLADLDPDDGVETLLRALAHVPAAELIVAGGPPRDELRGHSEHARLSGLARSLGIGDRVLFTGQVRQATLPPMLRSADIYVSTAQHEPTAMMSLQAMACGTPVVAPAMGGQMDAVVDGTTGVIVPPGKPALLAQRIREMLAHPMMLEAYGVAAADRARSRFSWERIAQETLAVYDEVLDATARAAA